MTAQHNISYEKPGKYESGTLVKLSYVDHDVLEKAQEIRVREKQKQEKFQKEVGRRIDNFGKEVGKHANTINKEALILNVK